MAEILLTPGPLGLSLKYSSLPKKIFPDCIQAGKEVKFMLFDDQKICLKIQYCRD